MAELGHYEMMVIFYPEVSEEDREAFRQKMDSFIAEGGGNLQNIESWGKRTLAYEIDDRTEGFYTVYSFQVLPKAVPKIAEMMKLDTRFLRYKVFRKRAPGTGAAARSGQP